MGVERAAVVGQGMCSVHCVNRKSSFMGEEGRGGVGRQREMEEVRMHLDPHIRARQAR
jgi:hypothetical protein